MTASVSTSILRTTNIEMESSNCPNKIFISFASDKHYESKHPVKDCGDCSNGSVDTNSTSFSSGSGSSLQLRVDTKPNINIQYINSTRSILRNSRSSKRPLNVSFSENIATVHVVDNLKLSLTRKERKRIWGSPALDLFDLAELYYEDDEEDKDDDYSMESRLRKFFGNLSSQGDNETDQKDKENTKESKGQEHSISPTPSKLRSLKSHMCLRGIRKTKKIAIDPFRSKN